MSGNVSRRNGRGDRRRRSHASARGGAAYARGRSGREALAASRPTALEERPARPRRHPRTEAVAALPPAHVGLIGPLHESERGRKIRSGGAEAKSIDKGVGVSLSTSPPELARPLNACVEAKNGQRQSPAQATFHRCGRPCGASQKLLHIA